MKVIHTLVHSVKTHVSRVREFSMCLYIELKRLYYTCVWLTVNQLHLMPIEFSVLARGQFGCLLIKRNSNLLLAYSYLWLMHGQYIIYLTTILRAVYSPYIYLLKALYFAVYYGSI